MTEPADKSVQLKAAKQVATQTIRHAATAEWLARRRYTHASRGGKLVLPQQLEETAVQAIHARALAKLDDIAQHDPEPRWQLRALEILTDYHLERLRIQAGLDAKHPIVEAAKPAAPADDVPREEKIRILRALARSG